MPRRKRKDVFLCHSAEDKPMVRSIALGLERYDISSWLDEAEMLPGDSLIQRVSDAIHKATWFLVFLTPNSVKKPWVKFELSQAMSREIANRPGFVVPVLLHDCRIPSFLRDKLYVDMRDWDYYGWALEKLVVKIRGDISSIPADFILQGIDKDDLDEAFLLSLPHAQAALEMKLRYERWTSRRLSTLRQYSGLTTKQVITYCETNSHIILSPVFNATGEVFYELKWKVMGSYSDERDYWANVNRYLISLRMNPSKMYSKDIISYLLTFHH